MTYMTRAVGYTSTLGELHGPVCIKQEERLTTLHFGFDLRLICPQSVGLNAIQTV